jgi:hypothetical protein
MEPNAELSEDPKAKDTPKPPESSSEGISLFKKVLNLLKGEKKGESPLRSILEASLAGWTKNIGLYKERDVAQSEALGDKAVNPTPKNLSELAGAMNLGEVISGYMRDKIASK